MVAHEKRNPAQLFCAVPTQNDLALSSLLFSDHPTQKLEYPRAAARFCTKKRPCVKVRNRRNICEKYVEFAAVWCVVYTRSFNNMHKKGGGFFTGARGGFVR